MYINADSSSIKVHNSWERADAALLDHIAQFPVALIGDTVGRMGMMTSFIRPQTRLNSLHGTVLPISTRDGDNLAIHRGLDEASAGDVLIIDAHAETNRAVFGDILGEICISRGVSGVIIDGATRDVDELDELGLPVFARAVNPAGPAKNGPGSVGIPVACANVVCCAGDAVFADRDGVILIARGELEAVAKRLEAQDSFEDELRARIRNTSKG